METDTMTRERGQGKEEERSPILLSEVLLRPICETAVKTDIEWLAPTVRMYEYIRLRKRS